MKRILIIAEYFAPNNHIASIRPTKLAKYFKLNGGYHVSVVSRYLRFDEFIDPVLHKDLQYVDEHIIIKDSWLTQNLYYVYCKLVPIKRKKIEKKPYPNNATENIGIKVYGYLLSLTRRYVYHTFLFRMTKNYAKRVVNIINKKAGDYDIVLTSSGPFSADIAGYMIKSKNPNILWIADYRDPLKNSFMEKRHYKYYKTIRHRISEKADIITGVSNACTVAFEKDCCAKIHTIYSGFDRDDINRIKPEKGCKFMLTYAGSLYNGKRDISVVFKVIAELIEENKIDKNNIVVHYLGSHILYFNQQANAYDLTGITEVHGLVNREKSLQFQLNSDVLLLASWNNINDTGVITGKFLEYMMMNKPIICIIMGNLANSTLKELIINANNGIVWEQANDKVDYHRLKVYILKQYERYLSNLPVLFEPNIQYIAQFDYKEVTKKFINLIVKST